MAYLKKELYGLALSDADKAIELDPNYVKAYFRRALSNMALGKFRIALKDYDTVLGFTRQLLKKLPIVQGF